jgi:hypothetical protein
MHRAEQHAEPADSAHKATSHGTDSSGSAMDTEAGRSGLLGQDWSLLLEGMRCYAVTSLWRVDGLHFI